MKKNIPLIVAGIVVIAAVLLGSFFLFGNNSSNSFSELNKLNPKVGLAEQPLHTQTQEVFSLSFSNLVLLKSELENFNQKQTNAPAKELSAIYLKIIESAILYKNTALINDSISLDSDFCSNLPKFREINSNIQQLSVLEKEVSTKTADFVRKYPTDAREMELSLNPTIWTTEFSLSNNTEILQLAEAECA